MFSAISVAGNALTAWTINHEWFKLRNPQLIRVDTFHDYFDM